MINLDKKFVSENINVVTDAYDFPHDWVNNVFETYPVDKKIKDVYVRLLTQRTKSKNDKKRKLLLRVSFLF